MKKTIVNPYLPSYEYVPDGEPHVFGDRVYIYGSHDRFKGESYCMNDYVCWSAPVDDLTDWRFEGVIYKRTQDPTPIEQFQHYMWAPDVVKGNDGRYYLYYAMEWYNRIAVAVCDTPAGKYEYYGEVKYSDGTRYGGKPYEIIRFDPGLLNDNGRVYLYTGFSSDKLDWIANHQKVTINANGSEVVELGSDMLTIVDGPKPFLVGYGNSEGTGFEGHEFYEASSMRKFDGKYYAIYSSALSHELAYAVSDYPDKGFVYGGTLHSNGNVIDNSKPTYYWGNNHGSVEKINGKYYVFGHRQTYKNESSRQGIAECIEMIDGKFIPAEMTTQGLYGQPLPCEGIYEAGCACVLYSKDGACKITEVTGDNHPFIIQEGEDRECNPAQFISNICDGTVIGYKYFNIPENGVELSLTVRAIDDFKASGILMVSLCEDFNSPLSQEIEFSGEKDIVFRINSEAEKKPLYIKFTGEGHFDLISLKWNK